MNNIVIVIVSVFLILIFVELLLGFYVSNKRNKYRRIVSNERIREQFSKTRQELFRLVTNRELDANSYTFKAFYKIHTFILRSPDKYEELGRLLADAIVADSPDDKEANLLKEESKNWSKNTKKLAMSTGRGFAIIVDEFAPLLKFLPRMHAKLLITIAELPEQTRSFRKISEAENTMFDLAEPVHA